MSTIRRHEGESCKTFLERLSQENRAFYESDRGKGALKDLQQKFPHAWLYVSELIQNAVDEKATIIHIETVDDKTLVLEHNGEEFDFDQDVIGLCTKGVSSKGAGTVGFMGVGFKAVFKSFETVKISSGEWKFTLKVGTSIGKEFGNQSRNWLGAVLPVWDSTIATPSKGMTCRFELTDRVIENHTIESDLEAVFKEDKALLPLLARQNIQELDWNGVRWGLSVDQTVPFDDYTGNRLHVSAVGANHEIFSWIILSKEYTPSLAAIRKFLEHRQLSASNREEELQINKDASRTRKVEAFFQVDDNLFPILPDFGEAYALLPTSVRLPIGINIQADWLLTQSRQEFMDSDLKDNPWHREIIVNIPKLTKLYFEWVVGDNGPKALGEHTCSVIYNILPAIDKKSVESYGWFLGDVDTMHAPQDMEYCKYLYEELKHSDFIARHIPENSIGFIDPITARVLPVKLSINCGEKIDLKPWFLFGENIASRELLGQKAVHTLLEIGLLKEMESQELASYWENGVVKSWHDSFEADVKDQQREALLHGLYEMDEQEEWRSAPLKCLPSEAGDYIARPSAVRYPSDWNIIVSNHEFAAALKPFIEERGNVVLWDFDRTVTTRPRNLKTKAKDYIETIGQADLSEIVASWWGGFGEISASDVRLISEFTAYICEKFPQRKKLIKKVICLNGDQVEVLNDLDDALLVEPYAHDYRRLYFPTHPIVSPCYYKTNESLNWRPFFESCDPPTIGKFVPVVVPEKLSVSRYHQIFKTDRPALRATAIKEIPWTKSPKVKVDHRHYHHIDFLFTETINNKLESGTVDRSFGEWLNEDSEHLRKYLHKYLLCIPLGQSSIKEEKQVDAAKWVTILDNCPWIYSKLSNDGPYKPEDILKSHDPVRPDTPVADLSHDLILLLESSGIKFGKRIPKAGPMQKLLVQGSNLPTNELASVIAEILNDDDPGDIESLKKILKEKDLIPVPSGIDLLDGSARIPFSRIVKQVGAGYRSNLNWIISVSDLKSDINVLNIFKLLNDIYIFPQKTTANHAIDFLEWVWKRKPDAESVRRFLPFAYAYINEEILCDKAIEARWYRAHSAAVVYTLGRQWVSVSGGERIYFDDLNISEYRIIPKHQLVTPSHLASTDKSDQQIAAVKLLGLDLISDHYKVYAEKGNLLEISECWKNNFIDIQKAVIEILNIDEEFDENGEDYEDEERKQNLALNHFDNLTKKIIRLPGNEVIESKQVYAIQNGNFALVCGEPVGFSSDLCDLLISYYNASRKKNISMLASEITRLIFCIDQQSFSTHIEKFKDKFGIDIPSEQNNKINGEIASVDIDDKTLNAGESINTPYESGQGQAEINPDEFETDIGPSGNQPSGTITLGTDRDDNKQTQLDGGIPSSKSPTELRDGARSGQATQGGTSEGRPPTKSGHGKSTQPKSDDKIVKRTSRLLSYVTSEKTTSDDNYEIADDESPETIQIGRAAEAIVMDFEKRRGWLPKNMNEVNVNHHGFDIQSTGPDQRSIYIEVKGINGPWSNVGVGLTATQFSYAIKYQEDYFLYVVENSLSSEDAKIYRIENPAMQVNKFQFDHGWKNAAIAEAPLIEDFVKENPNPCVGQRVRISTMEDAEGAIIAISGNGIIQRLTIALDDGDEIQRIYNPCEIKLI